MDFRCFCNQIRALRVVIPQYDTLLEWTITSEYSLQSVELFTVGKEGGFMKISYDCDGKMCTWILQTLIELVRLSKSNLLSWASGVSPPLRTRCRAELGHAPGSAPERKQTIWFWRYCSNSSNYDVPIEKSIAMHRTTMFWLIIRWKNSVEVPTKMIKYISNRVK